MAEVRTEEAQAVEELRAVRFTLVDRAGNVRAAIGPGADGAAGLALYDVDDRRRAELSVDPGGAANLKLHDRDGEVCAWLAVGRHGDPSLYLQGTSRHRDGVRGHAKLSVDEHGSPVLSLHDRDGQPRVLLALEEETGTPTLSYSDARGDSCLLLTEDGRGGRLHLFRRDGRRSGVPALAIGNEGPASSGSEDPRVAAMAERVARLERVRSRHWVSTAALVLLGALAGTAASRLAVAPREVPAAEPAAAPRIGPVIQAEELLLTDKNGTLRARLGLLPDGTPLLWMADAERRSTVELSVLPDSGALLRLSGGSSTIALVAPPGESPSVGAYDGTEVLFQAPSNIARFLPPDLWP